VGAGFWPSQCVPAIRAFIISFWKKIATYFPLESTKLAIRSIKSFINSTTANITTLNPTDSKKQSCFGITQPNSPKQPTHSTTKYVAKLRKLRNWKLSKLKNFPQRWVVIELLKNCRPVKAIRFNWHHSECEPHQKRTTVSLHVTNLNKNWHN
jgi:hypothetical protein